MAEENPPRYTPTGTFTKGDLVVISYPNDPNLKGLEGEVLSDSQWVVHANDGTVAAHAVEISGTKDTRVIYGPEMTLAPKNNRNAMGRSVTLQSDDGSIVHGVYKSEPRDESEEGILQVVELEETGEIIIEVRPRT